MGELLGKGMFSKVYKAVEISSSKVVAMKVVGLST